MACLRQASIVRRPDGLRLHFSQSLAARCIHAADPAEVSRVRGRVGSRLYRRLPPRLPAAEASPQPDRLGHLVSRARDDKGWRPMPSGAEHSSAPVTSPPDKPAFARSPFRSGLSPASRSQQAPLQRPAGARAASRVPPRRGARSAAPEVPSIDELPRRGWVHSPQLVNKLWAVTGAFAIPGNSHRLDGTAGCEDSIRCLGVSALGRHVR